MSDSKPPRRRLPLLAAPWVLLMALPLLAFDDCSPSPRPCDAPGMCDAASQLPACIQFCVDRVPREEALGQTCVVDPCDEALLGGSAILCPSPLSCLFESGGLGTCVDVAQPALARCQPSPHVNTCATGLFCRPFKDSAAPECPSNAERPSGSYYAGWDGVCLPPVREGGLCDANWGQAGCAVCEPGTQCAADPNRNNTLRCLRPCANDLDCPNCESGGGSTTCETGFCTVCVQRNAECESRLPDPEMDAECAADPFKPGCPAYLGSEPYACCDPNNECRSLSGTPSSTGPDGRPRWTGTCCGVDGADCETDGDCCRNQYCDPAGNTCNACVEEGAPASANYECCGDRVVRGGVCRPPCNEDGACPRPSCEVDTEWVCTDRGDECLPVEDVSGEPDVCDGVNNDCDENVDEDFVPGSCSFTDPRCASSFTVAGQERCDGGTIECVPVDPYCVYEFDNASGGGALATGTAGHCYDPAPIDCGTGGHSDCPPNQYCAAIPDLTTSNLACWPFNRAEPDDTAVTYPCPPGTAVCWHSAMDKNTTGYACPGM